MIHFQNQFYSDNLFIKNYSYKIIHKKLFIKNYSYKIIHIKLFISNSSLFFLLKIVE
jgi:hypothetical protein